MAKLVRVKIDVSCDDGEQISPRGFKDVFFSPGANLPKEEEVALINGFTALTVPSGAKAVLIFTTTTGSLTLKGVTGDTGVALTPSSNVPDLCALLPVSAPSIGIAATAAATIRVIWL